MGGPTIQAIQSTIVGRLDYLEKMDPQDEAPEVPQIKELTEQMSGAVTDVRNQFRVQLTAIIEATATLFEHLVELTQGIDAVRQNHDLVLELARRNRDAYG